MSLEYRENQDYFFGTLEAPLAVSDLTMKSTAFVPLATHYSNNTPGTYIPVVLHDPAGPDDEIVYIVGHASGSDTVTIQRGKEGSTAQSWPKDTQVVCAPTRRDAVTTYTRANLPSDAHVGFRNAVSDEGMVVERTRVQGWQPSVGVANPSEVGPRRGGSNPPANSNILIRTAFVTGLTTDASGNVSITYRAPFPQQTIAAVVTPYSVAPTGIVTVEAETPNGFTVGVYNPSTGAKHVAGSTVALHYIATGY